MQKKYFPVVLMSLNFLTALSAFYAVSRAIKIAEASTWLVPMVWISVFMLTLFLTAVFVKNILAAEMVIALSLLTSLFFAFTLVHFLIILACASVALSGIYAIRRDLDLNVKISLWKSLYLGKFRIVMAVAVLIASQYFFTIKNIDGPVNVPRIDLSQYAGHFVTPILGIANPQFAEAAKQNLTVDEFIIQAQKNNQQDLFDDSDLNNIDLLDQNIPQNLPLAQRELLKQKALEEMKQASNKLLEQNQQLVLQEGRRQLAKISGRNIDGNEKVTTVFTGMINDRINNYFQPVSGNQKSTFLPLVLSLVLLLTIWPIGSLLSNVWFLLVILLFKLFVKIGLVEIKRIMVEREMIN